MKTQSIHYMLLAIVSSGLAMAAAPATRGPRLRAPATNQGGIAPPFNPASQVFLP